MSTIDLSWLQPISWVAAAIGVCIASFYYAINIRETNKNRKATLTNELLKNLYSEEGQNRFVELAGMQWTDLDDYMKKYDSRVNPGNYAKRSALWYQFEILGYQYRSGIIDKETAYNVCHLEVINTWVKFKPIIDEYRKHDYGMDFYENWEYLARDMARIKMQRDPNYKGYENFGSLESWKGTYGAKTSQ